MDFWDYAHIKFPHRDQLVIAPPPPDYPNYDNYVYSTRDPPASVYVDPKFIEGKINAKLVSIEETFGDEVDFKHDNDVDPDQFNNNQYDNEIYNQDAGGEYIG